MRRLLGFNVCCDEQQRGVKRAHDRIVESFVTVCGEPPFKGEDEAEDFDEVEGGDEDIFIGCPHELQGLLGEESHVFVNGIVGNVFICGII